MNFPLLRQPSVHKALTTAALVFAGAALFVLYATAAELAAPDKAFLLNAAQSGHAELAASKSAQGKGSSEEVKRFAAVMVTDHQQVSDELQTLAAQKGVKVSDEPSKAQQAKLAKLNGLSGSAFDHEFANEFGVAAHKEAVALFRKNAQDAKDPDVKAFAARTLPGLEHHLEMAQALKLALDKQ